MPHRAPNRIARIVAALLGAWVLIAAPLLAAPQGATAADGPTMTARVLLQGHARIGSWIAIEVRLQNTGPSITGELRLLGGTQGGTRYSIAVDLPSPSDKTWILHAQPPSFGQQLEVVLASGPIVILRQKVAVTIHDANQMIVGVISDNGPGIVGSLSLPAVQNQQPAIVVPLRVGDLPNRIQAWSALDRLIWQDVDASTLAPDQLAALRGWLAQGGRLVIIGGTAGIGALGGFPEDILPYRPTSTVDVAPGSLANLLGALPRSATDVPAMAGELVRGRAIATSAGRVIAAEANYGGGSVTILGIDPTVGWIGASNAVRTLWPNLIPPRSEGTVGITDDSQIITAVSNLPSLALPPLGGLLLILIAYIALIGPLNYLVLRRIDRREWAWITMPVLIIAFVLGSYAFGSALRGSSIIVNEVGIVRGAPDATEGSAQVYLGVFSPTRGTYQVAVPGGALLSSPISGDVFGGTGASLDVLQGDPPGASHVRDLAVGFGSLRTIRAESAATVPKIHAELELVNGVLTGFVRNDSTVLLERPALVLGSSVSVLNDLAPGAQAPVSLSIATGSFGLSLSDRIFDQASFNDPTAPGDVTRRNQTRHQIVDQLTFDPLFGNVGTLNSESPVILAWGRTGVLDVLVEGQAANRVANILYYLPASMSVRGTVAFTGVLLRSTMTATDAAIFNNDPTVMSFGQGTVTMAYRPIAFDGTLAVDHIRFALGFGPETGIGGGGVKVQPIPDACLPPSHSPPATCPKPQPADQSDGVPEIGVFDRTGSGSWHRLPHLAMGQTYDLTSAGRYADPASGAFLVRFANPRQEPINVSLKVSIEGTVK